jgi:hypothetical protein
MTGVSHLSTTPFVIRRRIVSRFHQPVGQAFQQFLNAIFLLLISNIIHLKR